MADIARVILQSLEVSMRAVVQLFAIIGIGFGAAHFGVLDAPARGKLAKLSFALLSPIFMLSLSPSCVAWVRWRVARSIAADERTASTTMLIRDCQVRVLGAHRARPRRDRRGVHPHRRHVRARRARGARARARPARLRPAVCAFGRLLELGRGAVRPLRAALQARARVAVLCLFFLTPCICL